jgi:hypothetical protein
VDRQDVESFLCRAAAAESVRELHAIAQAARRAHPEDADTDLVERVCWAAVPRLFNAGTTTTTRHAMTRAAAASVRPTSRPAPVASREHRPRFDWKARAAGM